MHKINNEDLVIFAEKCDILCKSKLILSDKKLSDILKCIATSEPFCVFIEDCLLDFNYKLELLKAKIPDEKKQGKHVLKLPEGKKLVAFVFCLLCEFDNKERDFTEFLTEFYGLDELFTDGFANFCNGIIVPFKDTVLSLKQPETVENELEFLTKPEKEREYIEISKEILVKIHKLISELTRNINREPQLTSDERRDYIDMAETFLEACVAGDKLMILTLKSALKYSCRGYKFLNSKTKLLDKMLEDFI